MKRAVVLGGGMVGATIAADMAASEGWQVRVADARQAPLAAISARCGAEIQRADLSSPSAIAELCSDADVVLGAMPSALGLATLRAVIAAGKHYVDISFMAEDPLPLAAAAAAAGVIAVVDCGIAPGLSSIMCGHAVATLPGCDRLTIYVGGLPVERRWPFGYKAGFAPSDVIEEYVRPARFVERGELVVREALSELEPIDLPGVGTVEAFNTDGLRTLIDTLDVPNMKEKTLRWPGHVELMRAFRATGLFDLEPVDVGGVAVRPRDVTAALVFPRWTYEPGEADLTVLRVEASGGGRRLCWDLLDYYDPATDTRSMSRCTAFPATAVARLIGAGRFPLGPGVYAPETPGREPGFLAAVLSDLEARGIGVRLQEIE
ncbi:MAG TPA: saccharopine dehydrogenase C-terminal domain-containing protein [Kofleriaceae bacterium]|nr:saccharopine dehydrogenase C-terminal domain-containing protein [Kofleriaceae bacterium]